MMMAEDRNEYDWIFDYTMQYLESDNFDSIVMDFVDENCIVFENNEENKFSHTDIHIAFKEHVEALMATHLGEIGITTELFLESCEKARNNRRINQLVFERLACLDDFIVFKKLMIRRNLEIQLEAVREYCEMEGFKISIIECNNNHDDMDESKDDEKYNSHMVWYHDYYYCCLFINIWT